MNFVAVKSLAVTIAITAVGAGCGWGLSMLRSTAATQSVEVGDYSGIIRTAHHPAVLFATSTCPFCRKARQFLQATKADYLVYEIDTSSDANRLYQTLDLHEVPVLVTEHSRIVGFSESLYRQNTNATVQESAHEAANGILPERARD